MIVRGRNPATDRCYCGTRTQLAVGGAYNMTVSWRGAAAGERFGRG